MQTQRSRWTAALGLMGVLLATVVLLELSARVHLFGVAGLHPSRVDSVCHPFESEIFVASDDPQIDFELKPNLDVWFQLERLRTNSRGMRYREVEPRKPPGVFRAAVLGSSFTFPTGVEIEDAFHARVERRLSEVLAPTRYEFMNFAVAGYHPAQSMALLEKRVLAFEPDLIVFSLTGLGARAALSAWPATMREFEPPCRAFFQSFLWRVIRLRSGFFEGPRIRVEVERKSFGRKVPTPMERLEALSLETGIPVVVARLEFSEPKEDPSDKRLRREAQRRGFHYVDMRSAFAGLDTRAMWVFAFDPHPDATAHGIFSDVLAEYLVEAGLVGPGREAAAAR